jgi:hypothetical protein
MKRYFFGIFAVALAVGFSAFTTKKTAVDYFVIDQAGSSNEYYLVSTWNNEPCTGDQNVACHLLTEDAPVDNQILKSDISESEIVSKRAQF